MPRLCKDYGHVYLLQPIAEQLSLTSILRHILPADYRLLVAVACFEISEAAPLYLFPAWREATTVEALPRLRSRDLTRFTERVGRLERERLAMAQAWTQQCGEVKAIVLDSTSVSCYAEGLDSVEGGYNRDEASLPQINLGILYAEHNQLPLYYQLYPGSIPDVTTLKNLVH